MITLSRGQRLLAACFAVLVATVAFAGALASPPSASANTVTVYCNVLVDPMTACAYSLPTARYSFNHAEYDGSGDVSVCERADSVEGNIVSRQCKEDVAGSGDDLDYFYAHNFYVHPTCGNNSSNRHTIYCYGIN